MVFRCIAILIVCFCTSSCGDYPAGYEDGYANNEKNEWLVFGRSAYLDGFNAGVAEKFQQDWFAQNLTDINMLHCPEVIIRTDPLMFLPVEYRQTGTDTYTKD